MVFQEVNPLFQHSLFSTHIQYEKPIHAWHSIQYTVNPQCGRDAQVTAYFLITHTHTRHKKILPYVSDFAWTCHVASRDFPTEEREIKHEWWLWRQHTLSTSVNLPTQTHTNSATHSTTYGNPNACVHTRFFDIYKLNAQQERKNCDHAC